MSEQQTAQLVRSQTDGGVTTLTIAHPPVNSISQAVIADLREGLEAAIADPECRVVVIIGDGEKFFAAGADVSEFQNADADALGSGLNITREIEGARMPVIAAVNGIAFGGGCEIALACDIRVASSAAKFGQPEIKLGIIPGWGGTQRLPRIIGRGPAMDLLLTGDPIDAHRALELGLVTAVFEPAEMRTKVAELAARIAAQAPLALTATKLAVVDGLNVPMREALEIERGEFARVFRSADAREGVSAFLEKRTPTWTGN
jgi:enoyl-CoA hydratase/carnithine racemase